MGRALSKIFLGFSFAIPKHKFVSLITKVMQLYLAIYISTPFIIFVVENPDPGFNSQILYLTVNVVGCSLLATCSTVTLFLLHLICIDDEG